MLPLLVLALLQLDPLSTNLAHLGGVMVAAGLGEAVFELRGLFRVVRGDLEL